MAGKSKRKTPIVAANNGHSQTGRMTVTSQRNGRSLVTVTGTLGGPQCRREIGVVKKIRDYI